MKKSEALVGPDDKTRQGRKRLPEIIIYETEILVNDFGVVYVIDGKTQQVEHSYRDMEIRRSAPVIEAPVIDIKREE